MPKQIPVSKGKYFVTVDDADFESMNKWKWTLMAGYAMRTQQLSWNPVTRKQTRRSLPMHREIMGDPKGMSIDHINGDKLDNRRENLRICTQAENIRNRRKPVVRSEWGSVYKGVQRARQGCTPSWSAKITIEGRLKHIGSYKSEVEAAKAYNDAALKHYGEYAKLNVIPE